MSEIVSVRRHDTFLVAESKINERMAEIQQGNIDQYCLYGDSAFSMMYSHVTCHYKGVNLSNRQKAFNHCMNQCRESVEHIIKEIKCKFKFINYYQDLKVFQQYISNIIFSTVLLTNCYTCLLGNQVSEYYLLQPPKLEEYMN